MAGNECGACCAYATVGGAFYAAGALLFGIGGIAMGPIIGAFCLFAVLLPHGLRSTRHLPAERSTVRPRALCVCVRAGVFTSCMHAPMRVAFKRQHGILAAEQDCLLTMCCDPCVLCQELRELETRTHAPAVVMLNPGYVQPSGQMMVQPQPMMGQPMMAQPYAQPMQPMMQPMPMGAYTPKAM
jgi:hypothetical protein